MTITDRILLRLHVEAVWGVRLPDPMRDDVELLPGGLEPAWRLCAADLTEGRLHIWRPDVTPTEREVFRHRASEALAGMPMRDFGAPGPSPSGVHREVALSLVASPRLGEETAHGIAQRLTERDRPLVEAYDPGFLDYYFDRARQPLIGVVVSGRILSLAHSSRRTTEACELGVDTLPEARRKGYALAATVVWTRAVIEEGLVPLYSADAANTASLRLADAAGYRAFARLATIE
jgi:RimJ/RimL family protein N-acetyltransferase